MAFLMDIIRVSMALAKTPEMPEDGSLVSLEVESARFLKRL